jgi:RNA polymerase sigma factor (sigma-70 family)
MPLLTAAQELALGLRVRAGDLAARDELVLRNRPFVLNRMRRYANACKDDDLLQAGCLGLIEAANAYDPAGHPGVRFISFASHYVHMEMVKYLYSRNVVRVTAHQRKPKTSPCIGAARQHNRRWNTACAAAANAKYSYFKRPNMRDGVDEPVDPKQAPPGAATDGDDLVEVLRAAMRALTPMEADVIRRRFGLNGAVKQTFRSLERMFGLNHSRFMRIERLALAKLREELAAAML